MVRDLIDQVNKAVDAKMYRLALFGALALPSICGALESPDGLDNKDRYISWFDKWVGPRYASPDGTPDFSGPQCYSFRCAMLHEGRAVHTGLGYSRILFLQSDKAVFRVAILGDALQLDLATFCREMTAAAERWLLTVERTKLFTTNYDSSFRLHPRGFPPYIVGAPVLS